MRVHCAGRGRDYTGAGRGEKSTQVPQNWKGESSPVQEDGGEVSGGESPQVLDRRCSGVESTQVQTEESVHQVQTGRRDGCQEVRSTGAGRRVSTHGRRRGVEGRGSKVQTGGAEYTGADGGGRVHRCRRWREYHRADGGESVRRRRSPQVQTVGADGGESSTGQTEDERVRRRESTRCRRRREYTGADRGRGEESQRMRTGGESTQVQTGAESTQVRTRREYTGFADGGERSFRRRESQVQSEERVHWCSQGREYTGADGGERESTQVQTGDESKQVQTEEESTQVQTEERRCQEERVTCVAEDGREYHRCRRGAVKSGTTGATGERVHRFRRG
uniref:Uncharacterized protein n=2 Tax=Knipowitschia caucasica TaxID=637954 RepID=A0AAV2JST8_KNICA